MIYVMTHEEKIEIRSTFENMIGQVSDIEVPRWLQYGWTTYASNLYYAMLVGLEEMLLTHESMVTGVQRTFVPTELGARGLMRQAFGKNLANSQKGVYLSRHVVAMLKEFNDKIVEEAALPANIGGEPSFVRSDLPVVFITAEDWEAYLKYGDDVAYYAEQHHGYSISGPMDFLGTETADHVDLQKNITEALRANALGLGWNFD